MKKQNKRNIYKHEIELQPLKIKNKPREEFRVLLEKVKYRGYEVEQISDGRKIVITKPLRLNNPCGESYQRRC